MKRITSLLLAVLLIFTYGVFALGSAESETTDQGSGTAETKKEDTNLGQYKVEIKSSRLVKDYEGDSVIIVKYTFTNNADEPASFMFAFEDNAYQDGVGLNKAFMLDDGAKYNSDNQTKDIKKGSSIDVEVAYELNDNKTPVDIEVERLFSFDDSKITKTFKLS